MAVETGLTAAIHSFIRDEERLRRVVDRLWDTHRRAAMRSFIRDEEQLHRVVFLQALSDGEDSVHYIYEWQHLLLTVVSQERLDDWQRFHDLVRAHAWSEAEGMANSPLPPQEGMADSPPQWEQEEAAEEEEEPEAQEQQDAAGAD